MIALRRNLSGVTRGLCGQNIHLYHFDDTAKIIGFPQAGLWKARFNSDSYNYDPNFSNHPTPDVKTHEDHCDGLAYSGKVSIGPYTVAIFSQNE